MIQMNKTIERIKKVILVLIIMLLGYGLFSMIINIKTTSKQYKINYDDKIYNEIQKTLNTINNNNDKIQKIKTSKLSEEDLSLAKNTMNDIVNSLNKLDIKDKKGIEKLSSKELYNLENRVYSLPLIYFSSLATIWDNNNLSYVNTKSLVDSNMSVLVNLRENMKYDLENNYRYFYNNNQNQVNILNSYLDYYTKLVEYNSNILLKVGDITNE